MTFHINRTCMFINSVVIDANTMSDVQLEVPSNGSVATDPADKKTDKPQRRPQWKKKPRYDGRKKKRKWEDRKQTDNEIDEKRAKVSPEDKIRRRKYCVILGYAGANYIGMQRNPEVNTIEEELLKAMFKNELITDEAYEIPQRAHFQRAARTDKGVSAARQCISMKLPEQFDLDKLNADLPSDIKIFGVKRVTKGFNAKEKCMARTYSYTLPTISFAPYKDEVDMKAYRVDAATLAKVNEILELFVGTHNMHNFTSRKSADDPSANRYIMHFQCGEPFLIDDVEFCVINVKGQSFMLHQIRKMIGLTLAIIRGITTSDTVLRSFSDVRLDIPMAPGLGLVLDQVHYDSYNQKYGETHDQLTWEELEPAIQEFRDKFIHPVIAETEIKDKPMVKWLESLPFHTYDERPEDIARKAIEEAAEEGQGGDESDSKNDNSEKMIESGAAIDEQPGNKNANSDDGSDSDDKESE